MGENLDNIMDSPIQEFFRGKNIFLTGGTGFMGRILVEKILRSCPHVGCIYMLVRQKKKKDYQQRLHEYFEDEVFHKLNAEARLKVCGIPGDIRAVGLGLSNDHKKMLEETVHVVFHGAATVRFVEPLPIAVAINVVGTREMFDLARNMKHLQAFVHVSSAFCNCHLNEIREEIYEAPTTHQKLIQLTQCIEGKVIDQLTPIILDSRLNTYVYTKSVAEEIVKTQSKGLPVSIFRPAIVLAAQKEPIRGWINNLQGVTGMLIHIGTGFVRTSLCDGDVYANIVPVDSAVNTMIATAWKTAVRFKDADQNENDQKEVERGELMVYNYVSSTQRPIRWKDVIELAKNHIEEAPSTQGIWCLCFLYSKYSFIYHIYVLLLHFLPAIIMDSVAIMLGKKERMIPIYKKLKRFSDILSFFITRNFTFHDDNVQNLWQVLSPQDKEIFPFDLSTLDWNEYFYYYMRGMRKFVMKEDPSTIPQGKIRYRRFKNLQRMLLLVVSFFLLRLLWSFLVPIFSTFRIHSENRDL